MDESQRIKITKWIEDFMFSNIDFLTTMYDDSILIRFEDAIVPKEFTYTDLNGRRCTFVEYYTIFYKREHGKRAKVPERIQFICDDDKKLLTEVVVKTCVNLVDTYLNGRSIEPIDLLIIVEASFIISLIRVFEDLLTIKMKSLLDLFIKTNHSQSEVKGENEAQGLIETEFTSENILNEVIPVRVKIRNEVWKILEHFDFNISIDYHT